MARVIICDESHSLKNGDAARTRAVFAPHNLYEISFCTQNLYVAFFCMYLVVCSIILYLKSK